ncbi:MAG: hypothetical protein IIT46_11115 [Lachnospiraceae bacterium]|nr:hypothetical protein [Lachnospiraceae bacterium]
MTYFKEQGNTMVITTKDILSGLKPILLVSHDFEDGMWEFLDSEKLDENEACIVSLDEIIKLDDSLRVLHDLPLGWIAYRNSINDLWNKECIEN